MKGVRDGITRVIKMLKIFEVKEKSPFGWESRFSKYHMLKVCETGDIISIHTNPLWGGSFEWLEEARSLTNKPILAKGFHCTQAEVDKAYSCGADYVLTVGWWNGDDKCFHECESLDELSQSNAKWTVWNSRDPRTGKIKLETIKEARGVRIGNLCQASNIKSRKDIHEAVDAVLVGQALYDKFYFSL